MRNYPNAFVSALSCAILFFVGPMSTFVRGAEVAESDVAEAELAGWDLVWSDEFDTDGPPNPEKWTPEQGFIRNNESQFYTERRPENARVEDGLLVIEARKERWLNPDYSEQPSRSRRWRRNQEYADYTSASLRTAGKASWTYGRVEVRAKLPQGKGVWPAIWMLGNNIGQVGWPRCGELDIMEFVGYEPQTIHANVHCATYNHAQDTGKGSKLKLPTASESFNVYAMEWHEQHIDFFVDGKKYFTFKNEGTGDGAWPFDKPQFLILNLAIGGSWGGEQGIDDEIFPQKFLVDYVRVYQQVETPTAE